MSFARLTDPDLPLEDLMTRWPQTISVFIRHKMLCAGCLIGPFHTVGDACKAYQLDEADFLNELFEAIQPA